MDPHPPYVLLSDGYECLFATPAQCKTIRSQGLEKLEALRKKLEGCPVDKATQEEINLFESLYDGSIYQADQYVNSILNSVLKNKLGNKTMVIIYGDHGEGFDHDFNFAHGHALYDSSLRIPVIIRHPHIQNNITIDRFGTNSNLFDLILYFLNAKNITKNKIDAQLFSKVDPTFYATNTGMTKLSIINSDYKYIYSMLGTCTYNSEEKFPENLNVPPTLSQKQKEEEFSLRYYPFDINKFSPIEKTPVESYPKPPLKRKKGEEKKTKRKGKKKKLRSTFFVCLFFWFCFCFVLFFSSYSFHSRVSVLLSLFIFLLGKKNFDFLLSFTTLSM